MKRKLEAELISIAHRILKLRNKSELAQLQQETLKLYEKISVLRFVEENFSEVKPTIGYASAEKEVEAIYEAQENTEIEEEKVEAEVNEATQPWNQVETEQDTIAVEEKEVEVEGTEAEVEESEFEDEEEVDDFPAEDNVEQLTSHIEDEPEDETEVDEEESVVAEEQFNDEEPELIQDVHDEQETEETEEVEEAEVEEEKPEMEFAPLFEISKDDSPEIILPKQITLEDFLSEGHVEPIFVRAEQSYTNETTTTQSDPETDKETVTKVEVVETKKTQFVIDHHEPKSVSLNDSLSKTINIGLNDRFGFERHLFGGSSEDMNRVLSQLSTFSNFSEAQEFIEDMVKPDYNNWTGKEEYAARFMDLVEKKFS